MGEHDDRIFIKRFSGVIAGLVIVTILIIIISVGTDSPEPGANPSREILAAERIAPVAGVRTQLPEPKAAPVTATPDTAVPVTAAPDTATPDTAAPDTAAPVAVIPESVTQQSAQADAGIDGSGVYNSACGACHQSGLVGAPIPGSEAWAEKAASGIESLTANAIAGLGVMPPKGGRVDLSDDEIRAAVEYMMAQ